MSTTLAVLRQRVSENIGDYISSTVTTALTTSTSVVDTALANIAGGGTTDYFEDWWVLITSENNIGAKRRVSAYNATTNTLTVQGGNFTSDAAAKATYELHRIDPDMKTKAINNAARNLSLVLKRDLTDLALVSGNVLPDFEWWTSSSAHKFYTVTNATLARTGVSSADSGRGQRYVAKVTASAANGHMYLSEDQYPPLSDIQGKTVSAYVWAYPEVANDATIVLYTLQNDGTTAQTLTSTTTCIAGKWTLLELEDQTLNDDLVSFQFRLKVATNAKYVYFGSPRLIVDGISRYMLPELFQTADIRKVSCQITGNDDMPANDIGINADYHEIFGWNLLPQSIIGTYYNYLTLPYRLPVNRHIEISGSIGMEDDLDDDTDTMSIDDPATNVLVAQACWELFRQLRGFAGVSTTDAYDDEIAYWAGEVTRLKRTLTTKIKSYPIRWSI